MNNNATLWKCKCLFHELPFSSFDSRRTKIKTSYTRGRAQKNAVKRGNANDASSSPTTDRRRVKLTYSHTNFMSPSLKEETLNGQQSLIEVLKRFE